jgi:hypothetical protein
LLFMMSAIAMIAGVVILEAGPVVSYLQAQTLNGRADPWQMGLGFGGAALLCGATTIVPIEIALRRLEKIER